MKTRIPVSRQVLGLSILIGSLPLPCNAQKPPQDKTPAASGGSEYLIIVPADGNLTLRAAQRLQGHIAKVSRQTPNIEHKTAIESSSPTTTVIAVGPDSRFANLKDFGLAGDLAKISGEGYVLRTVTKNGISFIFALGKSEKGASDTVWHLMRELNIRKGKVSVPPLSVVRTPFIKSREVTFCPPWARAGLKIGEMNTALYARYQPQCWDETRLRRYVDLLDCFGYDSIQLSDSWLFRDYFKNIGHPPEQWTKKIIAMAEEAHENGQTYTHFVFGSSVKDYEKDKPYTRPGACFSDPGEKQVLLTEYGYQANTYGRFADRIVTHWSDYGGQPDCGKCTIKTALDQHNVILERFKALNPRVASGFSLWNIIPSLWPGYENDDSIIAPGILSKNDTAITLPGGLSGPNLNRARHIMDQGYRPAVWMWRTLDIEHWHGMHVHTKILDKYFKSIPSEVANKLDFHTVDNVSQYLALSNQYLAAQLMWDPNQSGSELLREFAGLMFGKENADTMASVYDAIEHAGCYACPGHQPALAKALEGSDERLTTLMQARTRLTKVKIPLDFVPVFPTVIAPQDLIQEIDAQLGAMIKYADFQVEAKKLMAFYPELMSSGDMEGIKNAFGALPKVPAPTEYLWVNTFSRYQIDYNALSKELGPGAK